MNCMLKGVTRSLRCYNLSSPKHIILRRISLLEKLRGKPSLLDKTNHRVIYNFKYIVLTAGLLKTKYVIPIVALPLISVCFYLNHPKVSVLILVAGVIQFILVIAVSRLVKNMIGKIYINKEGEINNVIMSFIDSNGNRIDKSFSPDQLSLSLFQSSKLLGFVCIETECDNEIYKMNVRNACFYDEKAVNTLFHNILDILNVKRISKNK